MLADIWTVSPALFTVLHITYEAVAEACIEVNGEIVRAFVAILRALSLAHFAQLNSAGAFQA